MTFEYPHSCITECQKDRFRKPVPTKCLTHVSMSKQVEARCNCEARKIRRAETDRLVLIYDRNSSQFQGTCKRCGLAVI